VIVLLSGPSTLRTEVVMVERGCNGAAALIFSLTYAREPRGERELHERRS
jgi:hypothetical protein